MTNYIWSDIEIDDWFANEGEITSTGTEIKPFQCNWSRKVPVEDAVTGKVIWTNPENLERPEKT